MTIEVEEFSEWLEAQGAIFQMPTNEWEVLRYRLNGSSPKILYRKKTGVYTLTDEVRADYQQFCRDIGKMGEQAISRIERKATKPLKRKVAQRDQNEHGHLTCCYCDQFIEIDDCTLEHFLPVSKGGPNHAENAALSCAECNVAAGDKSVFEKIQLRDQIQLAMVQHLPWEKFDARKLGYAE